MERGRLAFKRKSAQQLFAQSLLDQDSLSDAARGATGPRPPGPGRRGPEGPWGDIQFIGGL